jgi:hypothetical protein
MALIGGGGAGNVAGGANPSGTGSSLNYIGNHAYANSGVIADAASGSAATTMLNFTTGASYFVGHLNFTDAHVANDNMFMSVTLDGQIIVDLAYRSGSAGADNLSTYSLLIPPFSKIEIKYGSSANANATVWLTGEVYA